MRTSHPENDLLSAWMSDFRAESIHRLSPATVSAVTAAIVSGLGLTTTSVATLIATGGGAHMTTAAIGATTAAHTNLKVAAALAAALTAGGVLAGTGNLPAGAQRLAADAAARVGIHIPKPAIDATLDLNGDAAASAVIPVGAAGQVAVMLDGNGLNLMSVDAAAGFTANVVAETADALVVEFRSGDRVSSVLVSNTDGAIASSVTGDAAVDAGASAITTESAQLDGSTGQTGGSFDGSTQIDSSTQLEGSTAHTGGSFEGSGTVSLDTSLDG